jgi:hypothetical protein
LFSYVFSFQNFLFTFTNIKIFNEYFSRHKKPKLWQWIIRCPLCFSISEELIGLSMFVCLSHPWSCCYNDIRSHCSNNNFTLHCCNNNLGYHFVTMAFDTTVEFVIPLVALQMSP